MEISMSEQDSYLKQLLDLMQSNADAQSRRMDTIESKLDANTVTTSQTLVQAQYTNGRVTKLEKKYADLEAKKKVSLLNSNFNPNIIYIIAIGAVLVLGIVATLIGAPIKGIL